LPGHALWRAFARPSFDVSHFSHHLGDREASPPGPFVRPLVFGSEFAPQQSVYSGERRLAIVCRADRALDSIGGIHQLLHHSIECLVHQAGRHLVLRGFRGTAGTVNKFRRGLR
jgi:hypothetical protein